MRPIAELNSIMPARALLVQLLWPRSLAQVCDPSTVNDGECRDVCLHASRNLLTAWPHTPAFKSVLPCK
jgi:hypothetical protein